MANKTKKPTGLSITRSGNTYTFKWKIASKDHNGGQKLEYEVYTPNSGQGGSPAISNTATSYSVTVANVRSISFRVRGKRGKHGNMTYEYSDWAAASWSAVAPGTPTLTYKNEGFNKGTIEWSCPNDITSNAVFSYAEYQTMIERTSDDCSFSGATVTNQAAAGSQIVIEGSADIAAGNFVRWFRIRAVGPGGVSPWVTQYHTYGTPYRPQLNAAAAFRLGSSTQIIAAWSAAINRQYTVDKMKVQYAIDTPTDVSLSAPSSGWSDAGGDIAPKSGFDEVVVNVANAIGQDDCLWVRVLADHDGNIAYSNELCAQIGKLGAPTIDAVPNVSTGNVSITITESTSCDVAVTAIFFRSENDPSKDKVVAILSNGTTTATINVPEIIGATHTCFGAYAFVGTYSGTAITSIRMRSDTVIDSDIPAVPPTNVTIVDGPADGTVRASWDWSWVVATKAELSWSTEDYAWESTAEPTKYKIEEVMVNSWIIAGLEVGKQYYFRVRLIDDSTDTPNVGPWSDIISYKLLGVPGKPILTLNKSVINNDDTLVARWATVMSGDDTQAFAEICLVTYDEDTGDPIYGEVIAHTGKEQSIGIVREWEVDETYHLALRTTSMSGLQSEWSDVVNLYVIEPININIVTSSIGVGSVTTTTETDVMTYDNATGHLISDEESSMQETILISSMTSEIFENFIAGPTTQTIDTVVGESTTDVIKTKYTRNFAHSPELVALPMSVTITGAGATGITTLSITRGEDLHTYRPDDRDFDGYEGEVIVTHTQTGEAAIVIQASDLIGRLDDGGKYYLIGKVTDNYGNSKSVKYPFWVDWGYKSFVPEVSVEMDPYSRIAKITPIAPTGSPIATCDIYRMSADKPELIVSGATFGTTYVDPYPAFGPAGGHRLVAITSNGDYATADGLGWYDTGIDDRDILRDESMVIDVDGEQIVLPYNLELSNKWNKDFKRTSYLGGSVQGDWNPAVTRDLTSNTVLVRGDDLDRQLSMRDLAGYAGIAHVRTPDGSSLTVNVQIDERQSYDSWKISYTLTMQAIDPEALDGMTLTEWEEMHPIVET